MTNPAEQPASSEGVADTLRVVAWLRDAGEPSDDVRSDCCTKIVKDLCKSYKPSQVERYTIPLVLQSEAAARIAALEAERDALSKLLKDHGLRYE